MWVKSICSKSRLTLHEYFCMKGKFIKQVSNHKHDLFYSFIFIVYTLSEWDQVKLKYLKAGSLRLSGATYHKELIIEK